MTVVYDIGGLDVVKYSDFSPEEIKELVRRFNEDDWDDREYRALPPDEDLIIEWERHNRVRVAGRSSLQPYIEQEAWLWISDRG